MKRILFGIVGWNIAETTRMIEVAKIFKKDYECHFFSYGGHFEHLVLEEGFILHHLKPIEDQQKIDLLWKIDRGESFKQPWTYQETKDRIMHEVELIQELKPQFAFLGSVLTFSLSCRLTHTQLFNVIPLSLSQPYLRAGLPLSPFLPKWLNRLGAWMMLHIPFLIGNIRKVAHELGLQKPRNFLDLWEGDVNIVAEVKALSPLKELPEHWYFSGPLYAHLSQEIPEHIASLLKSTHKKKIFFAMGSSANRDILLQVLNAFQDLDAIIIAPIESHLRKTDSIPTNVFVTSWLPALEVTQMVDMAVIHGGQGTVQTTVAAGVPFVGIGMQPEQELNIHLYAQFGNALQLSKKHLSEVKIKHAIKRMLQDESYRIKAQEAKVLLTSVDVQQVIKDIVIHEMKDKLL